MKRTINDNLVVEKTMDDIVDQQYVDIHCHCLPGLDDGPETMSDALDLCRALVADGVSTVIATPHQLGRFSSCNRSGQVRQAVAELNEELKNNDIDLSIVPGGDVRVDERIFSLLKSDDILTLADGGRYILLELPHRSFIDIEPLLIELDDLGVQSIISHPERQKELSRRPEILAGWARHSTHAQITTSSLLGEFGSSVEKSAWDFLSSGAAVIVATDSHNLNSRKPCMNDAFKQISRKLGSNIARLVCIDNPQRILNGQDILQMSDVDA